MRPSSPRKQGICSNGGNLTLAYDNGIVKPKKSMDCGVIRNNGIVKPKKSMDCGVIRNGKSYD
jgi:predicted DNA-binding antitoxin AbrB/MazE fold protein